MKENRFSYFVPANILEKGEVQEDGLPKELLVSGVASSMASGKYDVDNQILDVSGFDYSPFLKAGFLNLEHRGKEDYSYLVGEPTNAFVKGKNFHIEGKLYRDNPKARSIYELAQVLKKSGSSRKIGFSIEGFVKAKDPLNPSKIAQAVISGVAITVSPKNDGTELFVKGGSVGEYETQSDTELLVDVVHNGFRYTVNQNLELSKSMEAGAITGRETADQPTTGAGLKKESIDGVKKKSYKEKLAAMYKRKGLNSNGDCLSKADVLNLLSIDYELDALSCLHVYRLAQAIQKAGG